jgi:hypothetical protein
MSLLRHVNISALATVRVGGRGGRETDVAAILPGWRRVSARLYDYELATEGKVLRVELKKQVNLQWFDVGKYYQLTEESRRIWLLFVIHEGGVVSLLLAARLGRFVDRLCSLPDFQALGWNRDVFETAAKFKEHYPALQFKVKANILSLYRAQPDLFEVLYNKAILPDGQAHANA